MTRFSRKNPCPVCGGGDDMPRGQGERCHGYLSDDGRYAHCSRVPCGEQEANGTWAHRLDGECRCGTVHGEQHGSVEHGSSGNSGRVLSTIYDYEDEQGKLLFQVLRYAPKGFKQRRPHNSGWLNHLSCDGKSPCTKYKSPPHQPLPPARRVLYRLPKLLADPSAPVLIPEGEKDCDRLSELGYLATCNPRGAKKWRAEYSESLRGREVVIIPDADTLGRQHAREVASSLQGIASWVSVLELPNAKDASEFFDKGGTTEQLDQLLSETVEWNEAASAPEAQALAPQTPPEVREPTATNEEMPAATSTATGRLVLSAAEFLAERDEAVASLWGDGFYIAGGGYLIMSGEGGVGKTIIFLALHFALAAGLKEFLGFPLLGEPLPILILEAEGSRQKFRPRARSIAESYGLDLAKLPVFFHSRDANLSIDQLGGMMKACGARAVLMDPIGRFHDANENSSEEWRRSITNPLAQLGREFGSGAAFSDHYTKPNENRQNRHKLRGSAAKIDDCGAALRLEYGQGGKASRVLFFDRVRDGGLPDPDRLALRIDVARGHVEIDPEGVAEAVPDNANDARREKRRLEDSERAQEAILEGLDALAKEPGFDPERGASERALAGEAGLGRGGRPFRDGLEALRVTKVLERIGTGTRATWRKPHRRKQ